MTLWSGRVEGELAREVWAYLKAEDAELLPYDVEGTRLHAQRLHAAGLLDDAELAEALERLDAIDFDDLEADLLAARLQHLAGGELPLADYFVGGNSQSTARHVE